MTSTATTHPSFFRRLIKWLLWALCIIFILMNVLASVHAYKFTHFYDSLPPAKPLAEQTWWDKTKPIFTGINAAKKHNKDFPTRKYETVTLTTKDNLQLEAWSVPVDSSKATIIMFHGHGSNKSGIVKEADAFADMGYSTFLVDFRAHGGSSGNVCTIGEEEVKDVLCVYEYVRKNTSQPVYLYGMSMGAATILHTMAKTNIDPDKLILEMPFGALQDAVNGRLKLMGVPAQPMGTLLTFWGGVEHGFWAFSYKPRVDAREVSCPVLIQWGEKDTRVKRSEVESIYRRLSSGDKQLVVYPEAGHESLYKKEPEKWMRTVQRFLKETGESAVN